MFHGVMAALPGTRNVLVDVCTTYDIVVQEISATTKSPTKTGGGPAFPGGSAKAHICDHVSSNMR